MTLPVGEGDEYVFAARAADLPPGSMVAIDGIDRVEVCVVNLAGAYYAVSGVCTHKGGLLVKGETRADYLVCPYHKAAFRATDGRHSWPATKPLRIFQVKVDDGAIYVRRPRAERVKA